MRRSLQTIASYGVLLILLACGIKIDLPVASNPSERPFGAGDTSYIRISPDWDAAHGYQFSSPWDIIVGADGYLFVADHDQARIHVISAAGSELESDAYGNDFSDLSALRSPDGQPFFPMAIDQDTRLNLFIADSSNRLLVWNQYLNNVGVDSVAASVLMASPAADLLWVSSLDSVILLESRGWEAQNIQWTAEGTGLWQAPRYFWDASDPVEAQAIARFFVDPTMIEVTGISSQGNMCYVADAHSNNILGLSYLPAAILLTGDGEVILAYRGSMTQRSVSSGTGNGTVNDPRGMTQGSDGALYYTQWGENFSVHKVGGNSGFEYGEDDIMDIERYHMASDVSLDLLGNIYVADTGNDRIQQFSSSGRFAFNIGMSRIFVDSTLHDSSLVEGELQISQRDTTFQVEVADVLDAPRSVAVDASGIVYIADTNHQRVMRYRLSTELDYGAEN